MRAYELIAEKKAVDGKVSMAEISKFLSTNYRIAPRTMKSYIYDKGIFPKPEFKVWKNQLYTVKTAKELLGRAYLIMKLREYRTIPFSTIKAIFKKYKNDIDALTEKLLSITTTYTWYEADSDPHEPVLNERHAKLMRIVCERIEKGEPLRSINADEIWMDYTREGE